MLRTRRVENLRHGALTTTAGTREGSTITATAFPHPRDVVSGNRQGSRPLFSRIWTVPPRLRGLSSSVVRGHKLSA